MYAPILNIVDQYKGFVLKCDCLYFALGVSSSQLFKNEGEINSGKYLSQSLDTGKAELQHISQRATGYCCLLQEMYTLLGRQSDQAWGNCLYHPLTSGKFHEKKSIVSTTSSVGGNPRSLWHWIQVPTRKTVHQFQRTVTATGPFPIQLRHSHCHLWSNTMTGKHHKIFLSWYLRIRNILWRPQGPAWKCQVLFQGLCPWYIRPWHFQELWDCHFDNQQQTDKGNLDRQGYHCLYSNLHKQPQQIPWIDHCKLRRQ